MKSKIKVDLNYRNTPIISIQASQDLDDLRDKTLDRFLIEAGKHIGGRLCFIDAFSSKNTCGSLKEGDLVPYTITPINPDDYELLIDEINLLIEERNKNWSQGLIEEHKNKIVVDYERERKMNY